MEARTASLLTHVLAGALSLTGSAEEVPVNPIYELVLRHAIPEAQDLQLFLRVEAGRFAAGLATGLNGLIHEVDCSALTLDGDTIAGDVTVVIAFDGYCPADGKPLPCAYRLQVALADGKLAGTFAGTAGTTRQVSGSVVGGLSAPMDLRGYRVLDLQLENGSGTGELGGKSFGNRVYPRLVFKDGRLVQALIYGWGRRAQINYFESAITANDLAFDGKRLTGSATVRPTGGPEYLYTVEGTAVGTRVGGRFTKQVDGKAMSGGPFRGELQAMPVRPLDRSLYYLELHQAVRRTWQESQVGAEALQLMVFAPCVEGRFGAAMAYAAAWNHTFHEVDASGLRLEGSALAGELRVTMKPDPYMPPDHQAVPASYSITAEVVDGRIVQGSHTGSFKDLPVSGPVFGELLDQAAVPEPVAIHLKLEEGVEGGAPWFRRTWVDFVATGGRAERGGMSNNKHGWKGSFTRATVAFEGTAFTATIEGTVDETKGPALGAYTFRLKGRVIGTQLVGDCDTYREGRLTRSGTAFMGGFGPGAQPPAAPPE